jgi:hypothetical protein
MKLRVAQLFAVDAAADGGAAQPVLLDLSFPNIHCTEKSLLLAPIERTLDDVII